MQSSTPGGTSSVYFWPSFTHLFYRTWQNLGLGAFLSMASRDARSFLFVLTAESTVTPVPTPNTNVPKSSAALRPCGIHDIPNGNLFFPTSVSHNLFYDTRESRPVHVLSVTTVYHTTVFVYKLSFTVFSALISAHLPGRPLEKGGGRTLSRAGGRIARYSSSSSSPSSSASSPFRFTRLRTRRRRLPSLSYILCIDILARLPLLGSILHIGNGAPEYTRLTWQALKSRGYKKPRQSRIQQPYTSTAAAIRRQYESLQRCRMRRGIDGRCSGTMCVLKLMLRRLRHSEPPLHQSEKAATRGEQRETRGKPCDDSVPVLQLKRQNPRTLFIDAVVSVSDSEGEYMLGQLARSRVSPRLETFVQKTPYRSSPASLRPTQQL